MGLLQLCLLVNQLIYVLFAEMRNTFEFLRSLPSPVLARLLEYGVRLLEAGEVSGGWKVTVHDLLHVVAL